MGAVDIRIRKTKGGSFRLVTSTVPPDTGRIRSPTAKCTAGTGLHDGFSTVGATLCGRDVLMEERGRRFFQVVCMGNALETRRVWPRTKAEPERWKMRLCGRVFAGERKEEGMARTIPYIWREGWISSSGSICWRHSWRDWCGAVILRRRTLKGLK
ncbi:hypothetical protein BDW68DRAFT_68985 [Aspergillus falconensis]